MDFFKPCWVFYYDMYWVLAKIFQHQYSIHRALVVSVVKLCQLSCRDSRCPSSSNPFFLISPPTKLKYTTCSCKHALHVVFLQYCIAKAIISASFSNCVVLAKLFNLYVQHKNVLNFFHFLSITLLIDLFYEWILNRYIFW